MADTKVLTFRFEQIQLNRLDWRPYCKLDNPAVAALMAKMKIAKEDRAKVKLESMLMIARLKLPAARSNLLTNFVDTYLNLNIAENRQFRKMFSMLAPKEQEEVMTHMTSWRKEALQEGRQEEAVKVVRLVLVKRFGELEESSASQIDGLTVKQLENLAQALLDFDSLSDLRTWLMQNGKKIKSRSKNTENEGVLDH